MLIRKHHLSLIGVLTIVGLFGCSATMAEKREKPSATHFPKGVPVSKELSSFLKNNGVSSIALIGKNGFQKLDIKGKPIKPCAQLSPNGKVPHDSPCGKFEGLKIKSIETITIIEYEHNPNCRITIKGGRLWTEHAGGDGFPEGAYRCHNASRHPSF